MGIFIYYLGVYLKTLSINLITLLMLQIILGIFAYLLLLLIFYKEKLVNIALKVTSKNDSVQ